MYHSVATALNSGCYILLFFFLQANAKSVGYLFSVVVQEGHCRRVSGTEDDAQTWPARLVPPSWSARSELVTGIRPPNRTIGHLYDAVLLHQRTCCTCRDVTDIPDDCDVSSSTKSALCRFFRPASSASSPRRRRFSGWTRKRKR